MRRIFQGVKYPFDKEARTRAVVAHDWSSIRLGLKTNLRHWHAQSPTLAAPKSDIVKTNPKQMKNKDIQITLEEALSRASKPLAKKIRYSIELLQKAEIMALRLDAEEGFYLAFSGGKDSQALYHIAKLAGVKFRAHMNLTSVDPPDVIRFVKTEYPDVELIKPKMSIYEMAKKKRILPTMRRRWCCAEYKELSGAGKVTLIGVRKQESARRAKRQEISTNIKGKRTEETFDQWSEHEEKMVTCVKGKDKILVSPIIYWSERDVWEFLNDVIRARHCKLYDEGHTRIGCILCPMSSCRQKIRDIKRFPHVKQKWIQTIQCLKDNGFSNHRGDNAADLFRWWISGKSYDKFQADEILQQKINFKDL